MGITDRGTLDGGGHDLRPNFLQPYRCTKVVVDGLKIRNSPNVGTEPGAVPQYGLSLRGYKTAPIRGVTVTDCRFDNAVKGNLMANVDSGQLSGVLVSGREAGKVL